MDGLDSDNEQVYILHGGQVLHDKGGTISISANSGRTYFGVDCQEDSSPTSDLLGLNLLDRAFGFTVDLSVAGCNCNVALYLISMMQNEAESTWEECSGDLFYCDANNVCGNRCEEIDLMEANKYAFISTLHSSQDGIGSAAGYSKFMRQMTGGRPGSEYWAGSTAACIDTSRPFRVTVAFPVVLPDGTGGGGGDLEMDPEQGMVVTLAQTSAAGEGCEVVLHAGVGYADLPEVSAALRSGMVLSASYWGGDGQDLDWFDGPNYDGGGPCTAELFRESGNGGSRAAATCQGTVSFSNFTITCLHGRNDSTCKQDSEVVPATLEPTVSPPPTPAPFVAPPSPPPSDAPTPWAPAPTLSWSPTPMPRAASEYCQWGLRSPDARECCPGYCPSCDDNEDSVCTEVNGHVISHPVLCCPLAIHNSGIECASIYDVGCITPHPRIDSGGNFVILDDDDGGGGGGSSGAAASPPPGLSTVDILLYNAAGLIMVGLCLGALRKSLGFGKQRLFFQMMTNCCAARPKGKDHLAAQHRTVARV